MRESSSSRVVSARTRPRSLRRRPSSRLPIPAPSSRPCTFSQHRAPGRRRCRRRQVAGDRGRCDRGGAGGQAQVRAGDVEVANGPGATPRSATVPWPGFDGQTSSDRCYPHSIHRPGSTHSGQSRLPIAGSATEAGGYPSIWKPVRQTRGDREVANNHSITSSARPSSDRGIVRPRALAVLRLITSSNLVGCSTGRSPGLAPLRILST